MGDIFVALMGDKDKLKKMELVPYCAKDVSFN